jgi:hypothetical protein
MGRVDASGHAACAYVDRTRRFARWDPLRDQLEDLLPDRAGVEGIGAEPGEIARGEILLVVAAARDQALTQQQGHSDGAADTISASLSFEGVVCGHEDLVRRKPLAGRQRPHLAL